MSFGGGFGGGRRGGDASETMMVDSRSVGRIIGRGGSKIKDLQDESGAKIQVSREEDGSGQKSVEISGTEDQIATAKQLIDECLNSDFGGGRGGGGFGGRRDDRGYGRRDDRDGGYGRRDDRDGGYGRRDGGFGGGRDRGSRGGGFGGGSDAETIYVESSEVGRIIGRGGSRIREMEDGSGCRIKVSRDGDSRGLSSVELSGSRGQISDAKKMIQEAGVEIVNGGDDSGRGW